MKRIAFILTASVFAVLSTQSANAQIGVQAGYLQSDFYQKMQGYETEDAEISGFTAGFTYDFDLTTRLNIQTSLNYSYFVEKDDFVTTKFHYLDIPVHVAYDFHIVDELFISPFAGPRLAINIDQSASSPYNLTENDFATIENGTFDLMLGAGAAIAYDKFRIKAGYDWGLLNQVSENQPFKIFRNQFKIALGYSF